MSAGLNKAELKLLERAFAAQLPPNAIQVIQPRKSKALDRLLELEYLKEATVTLPGNFPVAIQGYELTLMGNMAYCLCCGSAGVAA